MSFLTVGIQEKLHISKVAVDDQYGNLDVTLTRIGSAPEVVEDAPVADDEDFEAMMNGGSGNAGKTTQYAEESSIRLYGVKTEKYNEALDSVAVGKEFIRLQSFLRHLLVQGNLGEQYYQVAPKDKAAFLIDHIKFPKTLAFQKEQGITRENVTEKYQDADLVAAISKSYFEETAELFTVNEVAKYPVRAKLVRQSVAKHFPAFPTNTLKEYIETFYIQNPIFEREDLVAADKSKVKYSKYEIEKKKNDATPVNADTTSSSADVDALFGNEGTVADTVPNLPF